MATVAAAAVVVVAGIAEVVGRGVVDARRAAGDELRDAFAQAGEVASASIVTDRETGRSRGFGFVEMVNDADADKAIDMWNGKDFGGRMLTVSDARPKA